MKSIVTAAILYLTISAIPGCDSPEPPHDTPLSFATTPSPPPMQTVTSITYFSADSRLIPAACALALSSTGTLNLAANVFTNSSFAGSIATAASNGIAVQLVLDSSNGTNAINTFPQVIASGGSVWLATIPNKIQNHVFTVDGGSCAIGNYYWSQSAIQNGNYLTITTDSSTIATWNATFGSLQASGTQVLP
jgi:hypothetical protein